MYRDAYKRPMMSEGRNWPRIPRDDGQAQFLEAMVCISAVAVLTAALGLAVGIPLAMMLNDICATLKC